MDSESNSRPDPEHAIDRILERLPVDRIPALAELFVRLQDELRALAARALRREPRGISIQISSLVNDVWMKLVDSSATPRDRSQFHALVATVMERILISASRRRHADKRQPRSGHVLSLDVAEASVMSILAPHSASLDPELFARWRRLDPAGLRMLLSLHAGGLDLEEIAKIENVTVGHVRKRLAAMKRLIASDCGG